MRHRHCDTQLRSDDGWCAMSVPLYLNGVLVFACTQTGLEQICPPVRLPDGALRLKATIRVIHHLPISCRLSWYIMISGDDTIAMNARHRRTLARIFADPVHSDIAWADIESLFVSCGAEVSEGSGSRVRVALNGARAVFHRPHPERVTDKGAVRSVRRFLIEAGVIR